MTATAVIPGSVLVLEDILTTRTHVEMKQRTYGDQIMVVKTSKQWATFLFSNEEVIVPIWLQKERTVFYQKQSLRKTVILK